MALSKIQAESMNLADTYAFTGTVSGAGTYEKLHSITASTGDTNVIFTSTYLTSAYDKFFFTFENVIPNTGSVSLRAVLSFDNGSTYQTTQYDKVSFEGHEGTASDVINSRYTSNGGSMQITGSSSSQGTFADSALRAVAYFHNTDVDFKSLDVMGSYQYNGGNHAGVYSTHRHADNRTSRCNNIKFYWSSGTWLSGKIVLYGVKS